MTGFPESVKDQILKLASINLCPNLSGQICCALMMNPPQPGEPSYAQYVMERDGTLGSLKVGGGAGRAGAGLLAGVP